MKLQSFSHSFGESNFHIVFKPRYSHDVLNGRIAAVCSQEFEQTAKKWGFQIVCKQLVGDHTHLFLRFTSWQSPSFAVHKLKGRSARKLFTAFPWLKKYDRYDKKRFWGGKFWSDGYFFRSIGSTTDKAVKFYIEVANNPELRKKYYTYAGKRKDGQKTLHGNTVYKTEDPYVSFLQKNLIMPVKGQKKINQFLN